MWLLLTLPIVAYLLYKVFLFANADADLALLSKRIKPSYFKGKVVWITGASSGSKFSLLNWPRLISYHIMYMYMQMSICGSECRITAILSHLMCRWNAATRNFVYGADRCPILQGFKIAILSILAIYVYTIRCRVPICG